MKNFDRRAIFFWLSAVASFALLPITPEKFVKVGVILGCVLIALGAASWIDDRSRSRRA